MGKDSLIKSTTKKKPAEKKEDETKQAKRATPEAQKSAKATSAAKPKKKTPHTKSSAKKKSAVKAKTTAAEKKKQAPKASGPTKPARPAKTTDEKSVSSKGKKRTPDVPPPTPPVPPSEQKPAEPADKMMCYGLAALVLLVLLVVIASWMNTRQYYISSGEGAIDIYQGKFAPKGTRLLMSFPGMKAPEMVKESYSKDDVFPIIYDYYLDKADMLLEVPGMPDFEGVKDYLNKSLAYAVSSEMKATVNKRLDAINLMVLLYKADVAASKNSPEDLEVAQDLFKKALSYPMEEMESTRIKQKAALVKERLDSLKAAAAEAEKSEADN